MRSSKSNNKDFLYTEMLEIFKSQGKRWIPTGLQLGVMQSPTSVKIGDLILNTEDLYFSEHLLAGYTFPLVTPYVSSVTFGYYDGSTETVTDAVKSVGLQKGDIVAVQKLNDTNMFVVLTKVVKAG